MERDIGGGSGMIRKVIAALSIAVFVLTASAGALPKRIRLHHLERLDAS